jgi:hypothetical protein
VNKYSAPNHLLMLFILGFFTSVLSAQIRVPENPLSTLNPQHPRLLVKSLKDFEDIKLLTKTNPFLGECQKNVIKEADQIIGEPVCTYLIPDGMRLLVMSRNVLNRSFVLSMAYRLTGERKYADRLWKDLQSASQFPDWNPRHFLDVGEMTYAFAIGYDWLFDVWTVDQKQIIKQAIMEKGLLRAKLYYDKLVPNNQMIVDFSRTSSNWNSVCNGGITAGALAIADLEPLLASELIKNALASVPLAFKEFEPDGGFTEGPTYWAYAMKYNVAMMATLESALGSDFGLSTLPGISTTGNFPIAMSGATNMPYQYADAWPNMVNSPVFFWLGKKFQVPLYIDYVKQVGEKSVMDMLWHNVMPSKADLPLDNFFTRVNVASMRSSWRDENAWFLGIKGGYNQDNHCHLDLGSFVVERNAVRWFVDLGVDSYDLPGYFDKTNQRWNYYRVRAECHNTLVINPDKNPDQELMGRAQITNFVTKKDKSFAIVDLTPVYKTKVTSAQRGFTLINKSKVLIQDEIKALQGSEIYWFAHTQAAIQLSNDGKMATLTQEGKTMNVEIVSPAEAKFEVLAAELLPTSIQSVGNNKNEGFRKLSIHLKNVSQTTIAVVIKEVNNKSKNKVKPLSSW